MTIADVTQDKADPCIRPFFRVKAIINGPMEAKNLVGKVGKFVEIDTINDRPVVLEINGRKCAFRVDEVELYDHNKAYPFSPFDVSAWKGVVIK